MFIYTMFWIACLRSLEISCKEEVIVWHLANIRFKRRLFVRCQCGVNGCFNVRVAGGRNYRQMSCIGKEVKRPRILGSWNKRQINTPKWLLQFSLSASKWIKSRRKTSVIINVCTQWRQRLYRIHLGEGSSHLSPAQKPCWFPITNLIS